MHGKQIESNKPARFYDCRLWLQYKRTLLLRGFAGVRHLGICKASFVPSTCVHAVF